MIRARGPSGEHCPSENNYGNAAENDALVRFETANTRLARRDENVVACALR